MEITILHGIWSQCPQFNPHNYREVDENSKKLQVYILNKQINIFGGFWEFTCVGKRQMWKLRIFVTPIKPVIDCASLAINNINVTLNGCIHVPTQLRVI